MGYPAASSRSFGLAHPRRRPCGAGPRCVLPVRPSIPFRDFQGAVRRWRVCLFSPSRERWPVGATGSSWSPQGGSSEEFGGWLVPQPESEKQGEPTRYISKFQAIGAGASLAVLLAAFAQIIVSRKGIKLEVSMLLPALHGPLQSNANLQTEDCQIPEQTLDGKTTTIEQEASVSQEPLYASASGRKHTVRVLADSTQQEALFVLKKLKVIEDDVEPDELCTRREYARWLVKANSLLERNPRHKIVLSVVTGNSVVAAFDDVDVNDHDFWFIQALGEVGIVRCRLSCAKYNSSSDDGYFDHEAFNFNPEGFLSRLDLINWRVQFEYPSVTGVEEKVPPYWITYTLLEMPCHSAYLLMSDLLTVQMLRMNPDYMDLGSVAADASPALFMDILSENKSIARRIFGNSRRLQPQKPATKAQAAVALTSGRLAEAIQTELRRLEAENALRSAEMEVIRHELMCRGEIEKLWEEKLKEEKIRGLEIQNKYVALLNNLNEERVTLSRDRVNHSKEHAALDCQGQLLINLKDEVNQLQAKLITESASLLAEREFLNSEFAELHKKQEDTAGNKSTLEVEKEALRILRSWVEEEARKSQLRAKVLESAARRWKGDEQFTGPQTTSPEDRKESH